MYMKNKTSNSSIKNKTTKISTTEKKTSTMMGNYPYINNGYPIGHVTSVHPKKMKEGLFNILQKPSKMLTQVQMQKQEAKEKSKKENKD